MPEFPFAIQWSIPENKLVSLKDSVDGYLYSTSVSNIPDFEYFLSIYPNGCSENSRGKVRFSLHLKLGNAKNVEADYIFKVESTNYSTGSIRHTFEKSGGCGPRIVDTKDFFDPEKKFIVNGNFTLNVSGTFKYEDSETNDDEEQKWEGGELGDELWEKDESKNFTIIADGKEIKVHKFILDSRSEVFSAMLKPHTKESIENKVEIPDFSSDVVEAAVKLIYQSNFVSTLSLDEMMSLLQFFDKYNLPSLKDKVELVLIDKISATNVCRLANCSILTNSLKLKKKCTEFLMMSFASKTAVPDIQILDKDVGMEIFKKIMVFEIVETAFCSSIKICFCLFFFLFIFVSCLLFFVLIKNNFTYFKCQKNKDDTNLYIAIFRILPKTDTVIIAKENRLIFCQDVFCTNL